MLALVELAAKVIPAPQPSNEPRTSTVCDAGLKFPVMVCTSMFIWNVTSTARSAIAVLKNSPARIPYLVAVVFIGSLHAAPHDQQKHTGAKQHHRTGFRH